MGKKWTSKAIIIWSPGKTALSFNFSFDIFTETNVSIAEVEYIFIHQGNSLKLLEVFSVGLFSKF